MANGRNSGGKRVDSSRDPGGFVALPWSVLDSPAYADLSHPARSLLLEIARQYVRDNNGRLLASREYLAARGWKSADVIDRAKKKLLDAGFIHETVKGSFPNKASWYAVTWHALERLPGYDPGAAATFQRGAYMKNALLNPSRGTRASPAVPSHGTRKPPPVPSGGPMRATFDASPVPSSGHHLEKPSACATQPTH
jgi:hypothetical protein